MKVPEWTDFMKTGRYKELSPCEVDWYFIRAGKYIVHIRYSSKLVFTKVLAVK